MGTLMSLRWVLQMLQVLSCHQGVQDGKYSVSEDGADGSGGGSDDEGK